MAVPPLRPLSPKPTRPGTLLELAAAGRDPKPAQSLAENDLERELAAWLSVTREPDAAAGFRAGWARLSRLSGPRVRQWERLWWKAKGEGDRLRAQMGVLLREISRLSDSG